MYSWYKWCGKHFGGLRRLSNQSVLGEHELPVLYDSTRDLRLEQTEIHDAVSEEVFCSWDLYIIIKYHLTYADFKVFRCFIQEFNPNVFFLCWTSHVRVTTFSHMETATSSSGSTTGDCESWGSLRASLHRYSLLWDKWISLRYFTPQWQRIEASYELRCTLNRPMSSVC